MYITRTRENFCTFVGKIIRHKVYDSKKKYVVVWPIHFRWMEKRRWT